MAWRPKKTIGKILKGALIAGGSVLAIGSGIGAIGGIASGAGALAGAAKGIGRVGSLFGKGLKGAGTGLDKVGQAAAKVVTGSTKQQRNEIKALKQDARDASNKVAFFNKLLKAGADPKTAASKAGIGFDELTDSLSDGLSAKIKAAGEKYLAGQNSDTVPMESKTMLLWGGGLLAALFILPKILKG